MARAGNEQGGFDADIFEGIERVIFNQDELTALGLDLQRNGKVIFADYDLTLRLDSEVPPDGPLNRYWSVAPA